MKRILRKCKVNKEDTRIYYKARKKYNKMIIKKIEEKGKKIVEELKKDNTRSKFWQAVNQNRKKEEGVEESIESKEWVNHFEKQLGGKDAERTGEERLGKGEENKERSQETIDKEEANKIEIITLKEVEEVIKNLKRKKAPGRNKK